ncbi:CPBP family intramembrane glutamic endopeptidase [Chloracidobacterium aggregatum]|uniref:CPBP family intramembrane metalloprotease n=1 Tax=Chloracidobacterium sp. N TaxID=2821540 RepID=A0ABX8AW80_9BACT|nr:CPBP family intramembrane glutamic endopeptidase [Chloracidobacterium aggregatum]QUV84695.1 CPBP family intramembrane metalloprotease [Chloracidobacterium sp. 2]QUV86802.1 CPBP family intramembrane metalloprotease [Chloracidobacterium sp. S]QUV91800.1 CPBP family intramembrane metalloprotease [Chloracidobacterium sp. A]QUV92933.1 CPBP family intramembrane metalloprotease [Chloracidobacterium sp. N]QUV96087.1 CPBP family intramembrane metalloprotease [Chloracidobacterium sp. E]
MTSLTEQGAMPPANPAPHLPVTGWNASAALVTWLLSMSAILLASIGAQLGWTTWFYLQRATLPTQADLTASRSLTLTLVLSTFVAHGITLLWCWQLIRRTSPHGVRLALGLDWYRPLWSRRGAFLLACGFAAPLFLAVGAWLERYLPNAKTDLDRILAQGPAIRVAIACVAALSAPLAEEVVYRGIIFGGLQRRLGVRPTVVLVSLLFLAVHIPQYWGGWAGLAMLALLSLTLTVLRAATGSILPSVMLHYAFNGIQAIAIVFFWELLETSPPTTP